MKGQMGQEVAALASMLLSTLVMVLGWAWWNQPNPGGNQGWLGNLPGNKCSVHALLMLTAVCFGFTQAAMSFRFFEGWVGVSHFWAKLLHGSWHVFALGLIIAALVEIVQWHDDEGFGHLSTTHSWLGLFFLLAYSSNFLGGGAAFLVPDSVFPVALREKYAPSHRFLGVTSLLLASCAMLTGIMQKAWLDGGGCLYLSPSTAQKLNPSLAYDKLPPGCRAGAGIAILVALNTCVALFALWPMSVAEFVAAEIPPSVPALEEPTAKHEEGTELSVEVETQM